MRRYSFLAIVAILALVLTGAALALANDRGRSKSKAPRKGRAQTSQAAQTPRGVAAKFAVFRRAARADDRVSVSDSDPLAQSGGANPALARHSLDIGATSLYLVPTSDGLCLGLQRQSRRLGVGTCVSESQATEGQLASVLYCAPDVIGADNVGVMGAVVDGVNAVQVTRADSSRVSIPVQGNSYAYVAKRSDPAPVSISWGSPGESGQLRIGAPPSTADARAAAPSPVPANPAAIQCLRPGETPQTR